MSPNFDYTQKAFWGGSWYPYWSLILISILGGLFGLDHIFLRSPVSGFLKFIFNIPTLGLWFFYDLIQILGEKDKVMKYGLSAPIVGALGIGAGMFTDNDPTGPRAKSPFRYLGYLLLTCLPFGFDFYLAGDTNGAFARFLTSFIIFLWPIGFIWGLISMFRAFFMPKTLFKEGTYRMFPMTYFMDANGPSVLGPVDLPEGKDTCTTGGITSTLLAPVAAVAESALGILLPGVAPATAAISGAVQAGAMTAKTAADSTSKMIEAATKPATTAITQGSAVIQQVPQAISSLPAVGATAISKLASATTPEGLEKLAQKGGGFIDTDYSNIGLFVLFALILGGGSFMAAKRLNILPTTILSKKTNGQERNDNPPEPRKV